MCILIIDDSKDTNSMHTALVAEGYDIKYAHTGWNGIQLCRALNPDLVLLNIVLSDSCGYEVCQLMRTCSEVPIILVATREQAMRDILRGFQVGADDCLFGPIDPKYLNAKVNSLLKRSRNISWQESRPAYIDEYLSIDLYRQILLVQQQIIHLSPTEYQILRLLVENLNQVITTLEIIEDVWGTTLQIDDNKVRDEVHTYVRHLRRKIEPDEKAPRYILTEHGIG